MERKLELDPQEPQMLQLSDSDYKVSALKINQQKQAGMEKNAVKYGGKPCRTLKNIIL